jgi:restriction system protein
MGKAAYFFENGNSQGRSAVDDTIRGGGRTLERILALEPYEFEKLTGELFTKMGFEVIVTKQSSDGGIDVQAVNNGTIFRGKYLIQCKRYRGGKVSRPEIVGFYGRIASEPGARGIFITSSSFTSGAREFGKATGINLIDGEELEKLVMRHRLL